MREDVASFASARLAASKARRILDRTCSFTVRAAAGFIRCGSRSLAAFPLVLGVVDPAGPTASSSPYSKLEAITDPARAGVEVTPVEWICRSFAIAIDSLSAGLSLVLGPWSQHDLFLQITPAKLVLGLLSALIIRLLFQVVRFFLRKHSQRPQLDNPERYCIDGLLRALRKAINLFSCLTAGLLFVCPLLPHVALAPNTHAPFQLTSSLAVIGYFQFL